MSTPDSDPRPMMRTFQSWEANLTSCEAKEKRIKSELRTRITHIKDALEASIPQAKRSFKVRESYIPGLDTGLSPTYHLKGYMTNGLYSFVEPEAATSENPLVEMNISEVETQISVSQDVSIKKFLIDNKYMSLTVNGNSSLISFKDFVGFNFVADAFYSWLSP